MTARLSEVQHRVHHDRQIAAVVAAAPAWRVEDRLTQVPLFLGQAARRRHALHGAHRLRPCTRGVPGEDRCPWSVHDCGWALPRRRLARPVGGARAARRDREDVLSQRRAGLGSGNGRLTRGSTGNVRVRVTVRVSMWVSALASGGQAALEPRLPSVADTSPGERALPRSHGRWARRGFHVKRRRHEGVTHRQVHGRRSPAGPISAPSIAPC